MGKDPHFIIEAFDGDEWSMERYFARLDRCTPCLYEFFIHEGTPDNISFEADRLIETLEASDYALDGFSYTYLDELEESLKYDHMWNFQWTEVLEAARELAKTYGDENVRIVAFYDY